MIFNFLGNCFVFQTETVTMIFSIFIIAIAVCF